ncbi:TadE/TadG family type IV pilus assembly protein [Henriciella aquimarina]|uniref:TadE/TadG family type IV pilus assembly protein n=1 Tax=Henriciella aquimarina TaxID=545261 RepID=UPI001F157AC3|nr:TadE/TadG family type IV pilus assembly protein [Henriciella aquimarina]
MLRTLNQRFRSFHAANKGISAVEFALIAPLMVLIYFACIELSLMMMLDRKVTSSAAALGDLVARAATVDDDNLEDIIEATRMILEPNPVEDARLRVSSLYDDDGTIRVAWSDARGFEEYEEDSVMVVPDDLVPEDGSVIYAEVEYDYNSKLGYFFTTSKKLRDEFYLRPRRVSHVARIRDN